MFWILEIFPNWIWWVLLTAGLFSYFLSHLIPLKTYQLPIKIAGGTTVAAVIFILGLLYANGVWQQAAQELQAKVAIAEAKSQAVNEVIKERVVTKTQVVKQRGEATVEYITRNAHNRAAETPP